MKAIVIKEFGSVDVLQYVDNYPQPVMADNQVLLKVYAAGINPLDWKIRQGQLKALLGSKFPLILGNDASGIVVAVGKLVRDFKVGDEVFCLLDANQRASWTGFAKSGAYAEYAVTRADTLAHKPKNITHQQAASIPLAALTAYQVLMHRAHIKQGDKVLINGASGGVGLFALQIAKALGANVTAICSQRHHHLVLGLGANAAIDYKTQDIRHISQKFDVIYDVVANMPFVSYQHLLNPNGVVVSNVVNPMSLLATQFNPVLKVLGFKKRYTFAWVKASGVDLAQIACLIERNQLQTFIEQSYTLSNIKMAHAHSESGKVQGKLVLDLSAL
ncbi:MAG: NADP-dependent oxidoreductase [Moraxellaceae bacterium]|nr:NADP-dependent oxidoreductase [Moraxellaceae bacterium]